jgi:hypothetical protein
MSPTWAILALLVIVLLTSATLTFRKGIKTYKLEAKAEKSPYAVELQETAGTDAPKTPPKLQETLTTQSSFYYVGVSFILLCLNLLEILTDSALQDSEVAARTGPAPAPPAQPPKLVTRSSFVNFGV